MFRLAVVQSPGDLDGVPARLDWLDRSLTKIAQTGADLVLLPELFACGYFIGAQIEARAEPLDGPIAAALSGMAKTHKIAVHAGLAERAGDTIYNAALCFGPDGGLLSHQRKLAIPPGFERAHFKAGAGCDVFEYGGLRVATLICYDAEFAETVRHVATLGADLVLVPTALGARWSWVAETMIPTRAYENGVFLAYANHAGDENGLDYLGASVIAAPDGVELARALAAPTVIFAEIDPARVQFAQARLPYLVDRAALKLG